MKKLLFAILLVPFLSHAWEPTKPVTVIVGNTPGAGNEIAFRKLAEIVQKKNPNFVYVVQNIPGADSVIANNKFLDAPADGHTINLPSHMSSYVTNDIWEKNLKKYNYDSFVDVLTMGKSPLALVASPKSEINTPQDFINLLVSDSNFVGNNNIGINYFFPELFNSIKVLYFVQANKEILKYITNYINFNNEKIK